MEWSCEIFKASRKESSLLHRIYQHLEYLWGVFLASDRSRDGAKALPWPERTVCFK
jgi:hypothetical protein